MEINEYISLVTDKITGKRDRYYVEQELIAHIEDRKQYYTDAGYDIDMANQKAMDRMGDPTSVGESMSALYNSEHYKKKALIFNIAYMIAIAFGCAWIIYLFESFNLSETNTAMLTCILSIICFGIMAFAYRYSHLSQDMRMLRMNGYLSVANMVIAPIMYLPVFSSILSLPLEFPVDYPTGFDFFYYPLDSNILGLWKATEDYETILVIISWVIMGITVFLPVINIIMSLKTARRYSKNDYDSKDEKRFHRALKYAKVLIFIVGISALCLTIEITLQSISDHHQRVERESTYYSDTVEAWDVFDKIEIPCNEEDIRIALGNRISESDWQYFEDIDELYVCSNNNYCVSICSVEYLDEPGDYDFVIKKLANTFPKITNKRVSEIYSADYDNLDDFLSVVDREEITEMRIKYDECSVVIGDYSKENLYLTFKNGKLIDKEIVEW